jgi:hypothetical protein
MPRERVLTLTELNRALLARQLLLRRARLPVVRAVERLGALQAQWPPAPFVALWSRLERFRRDDLARAVERRQLVKATLLRSTLHLVSSRDYLAYGGLVRSARLGEVERRVARAGLAVDLETLVPRLVEETWAEPRSRPELLELLGLPRLRTDEPAGWLLWHLVAAHAGLVHSPESSFWRRNTAGGRFAPSRAWLGAEPAGGEEAAAHLVRRHLAAFGPATRADVARWTGLSLAVLEPGFECLALRRLRDEDGRLLLDLPRAPLPPVGTEAPPRFLPMWDSALLAHDDRSRILPAEHRQTVIRRNGDIRQTFLVDGFVAGTWSFEDGRVQLEPFAPLPSATRRELEREAEALAAFHA